jgi:hypothetical protein
MVKKHSLISLMWKRLKYHFVHRRPIPIFGRKWCYSCHIPYNFDLVQECPLCGRADQKLWIVLFRGYIDSVHDDPSKAEMAARLIYADTGAHARVEDWRVE